MAQTLHGSCACGRNRYIVEIPEASEQLAQVLFDSTAANRRIQAAPVTPFLRVPLDWYHSMTTSYFPAESHTAIKSTYTSPFDPTCRRQFCGFCGTQLTSWNERTRADADFIQLTLGSLLDDSLKGLEEMGLLGDGEEDDNEAEKEQGEVAMEVTTRAAPAAGRSLFRPAQHTVNRGSPWFETLVEDSRFGKIKRQRGGHTSADGTSSVQWEVIEAGGDDDDDDTEGVSGVKRKISVVEESRDVQMRTT